MKLVLSGPNGFIGSEILTRALSNPSITSITALSRKPLSTSSPKLQTVIIEDFLSYSPEVLAQLAGADACIWTIGAKTTDVELTQRVTVDYTMYAAAAFEKLARDAGKRFRFLFTSGMLPERDPEKSLWVFAHVRRVGGSVETKLLDFEKSNPSTFETFIVKPGAVLTHDKSVLNFVLKAMPSIYVDELSAVMLDVTLNGGEKKCYENGELRKMGQQLLARK